MENRKMEKWKLGREILFWISKYGKLKIRSESKWVKDIYQVFRG